VFQGYTCGIHTTPQRDQGNCRNRSILDGEERLRLHQRSLPHCAGAVFGSSYSQNRVLHRFSVLPGLTSSSLSKQKASRVNRLHCAIWRQKWPFMRVGNDIDPRFQRLDPLLAIPGVNVISAWPSCCATVRIKRLPRITPVYLQNITPSLVLCPSPRDTTRDKTSFVPSPIMAESLPFLEVPRKPRDGFELSVPLKVPGVFMASVRSRDPRGTAQTGATSTGGRPICGRQ
jgi:hypothetical protein